MLCTYMTDCEYELSNTSRFGFQSTGLRIMHDTSVVRSDSSFFFSKVVVQLS